MNNPNPDPAPDLERLVDLALELGTPIEQLAENLGADVVHDATGFRAIPVELAVVLLDDHRRRQAEALEQSRARAIAARTAPRRRKAQPLALGADQTIADLMLAEAATERGPAGFDRWMGPDANSGAVISPARRRRRPREAS